MARKRKEKRTPGSKIDPRAVTIISSGMGFLICLGTAVRAVMLTGGVNLTAELSALASGLFLVLVLLAYVRATPHASRLLVLVLYALCAGGAFLPEVRNLLFILSPLVPTLSLMLLGYRTGRFWLLGFILFDAAILLVLHLGLFGLAPPGDLAPLLMVLLGVVNLGAFVTAYQLHLERSRATIEAQLEEMARMSRTDPLTGLYNRRGFLELVSAERVRSLRLRPAKEVARAGSVAGTEAGHAVIVLFDVDHFKKINDQHGHPTGDRVLATLGECLREDRLLRVCDSAGRYGGEEFILLLPDTNLNGAFLCIERIREHVERIPFRDDRGKVFSITISAGLASLPSNEAEAQRSEGEVPDPVAQTIARADKALYRAKAAGRNRSLVAEEG